MSKFLLDQMIDLDVATELRQKGYDILCLSDIGLQTADDSEVLKAAIDRKRTLITLDEHFGDWVFLPLQEHPGVIRIKTNPTTTKNITNLLLPFLSENNNRKFENILVIIKTTGNRWIKTNY